MLATRLFNSYGLLAPYLTLPSSRQVNSNNYTIYYYVIFHSYFQPLLALQEAVRNIGWAQMQHQLQIQMFALIVGMIYHHCVVNNLEYARSGTKTLLLFPCFTLRAAGNRKATGVTKS